MRSLTFLLLLKLVYCDPCPEGYTQASGGGDCYQIIDFYNTFATQYFPESFDEAETTCNGKSGGMLASLHNKEDNEFAYGQHCKSSGVQITRNIGIRCVGSSCKWDDGSPVTYRNFKVEPCDDGRTRCYGFSGDAPFTTWVEKGCGRQEADCWICRVKAKTIDCDEGETEYKGGCVSVHTESLDQISAETSCPGGGHLVSIHGSQENDLLKKLAFDQGINGTVYIGGQFIKGVFEWIDGSHYNSAYWANSFPNIYFGSCVQMLVSSGQWTNVECSVKQPFICFKDGANYVMTTPDPTPKADAKCPPTVYLNGSGTFYSPNYPLSIPTQQPCEYIIETKNGSKAGIRFPFYDCLEGTVITFYEMYDWDSNNWRQFDSLNSTYYYMNPQQRMKWIQAKTNMMKVVFSIDPKISPMGTGFEAEYTALAQAPAQCQQPFTSASGEDWNVTMYSPNYPLSIPSNQNCSYWIGTDEGTRTSITFTDYDCQSDATLSIYEQYTGQEDPVLIFTSNSPIINHPYIARSNKTKLVFSSGASPIGTGWVFQFTQT